MWKVALYGSICLSGYGFSTCFQKNIYSNRTQFILWYPQFDVTFGRWSSNQILAQFKQSYKFYQKEAYERQFIQDLVDYLIKHAILPEVYIYNQLIKPKDKTKNREWKVHLVKSSDLNAMACADGTIFVLRGLLDFTQSLDETAFILAHEISHALCRHIPNQVSTTGGLALLFYMVVDHNMLTDWLFKLIFHKPQSRSHESEADLYGVNICVNSGFDPERGSDFFERISKLGYSQIAFLSTHPSDQKRIKSIVDTSAKLKQKQLDYHNQIGDQDEVQINKLRNDYRRLKQILNEENTRSKTKNKDKENQ